jgi:hypothetical protein
MNVAATSALGSAGVVLVVAAHLLDDGEGDGDDSCGPRLYSPATRAVITPSRESTPPDPARTSGIQAKTKTMSAPV